MNYSVNNPLQQFSNGALKNFLSIGDFDQPSLQAILDTTEDLLAKKPAELTRLSLLKGKTVVNLFFENSTRTRTSFEIATKQLGAHSITLDIESSSTAKGESLADTFHTLGAMGANVFVIRHHANGAAHFIARQVQSKVGVVNAGDGQHSHPTQAMLDILTVLRHKVRPANKPFEDLKVAIVGDILHSRVARSLIQVLKIFSVSDIRLVGPLTLLPDPVSSFSLPTTTRLVEGIDGADIVISLRIQQERMQQGLFASPQWYFEQYGLTEAILQRAAPECIVMHPGPINRNLEIDSDVADGPRSMILHQVKYGVAIRMAIIAMICAAREVNDQ